MKKKITKNLFERRTKFFKLVINDEKSYQKTKHNLNYNLIITKKNGNAVQRFRIKRVFKNSMINLSSNSTKTFNFICYQNSLDIYQDFLIQELKNSIISFEKFCK